MRYKHGSAHNEGKGMWKYFVSLQLSGTWVLYLVLLFLLSFIFIQFIMHELHKLSSTMSTCNKTP